MAEEKTEMEIINEKITETIKTFTEDSNKRDKVLELLKKNQNNFYNWQQLEKGLNSYINTDEACFNYIEKSFGSGMLMAIVKKLAPDMKKSLKVAIDEQIAILERKNNGQIK